MYQSFIQYRRSATGHSGPAFCPIDRNFPNCQKSLDSCGRIALASQLAAVRIGERRRPGTQPEQEKPLVIQGGFDSHAEVVREVMLAPELVTARDVQGDLFPEPDTPAELRAEALDTVVEPGAEVVGHDVPLVPGRKHPA